MPDFLCPVSAGAQEDVGNFRNHSVIVIVGNSSFDVLPVALKPIAAAGLLIALAARAAKARRLDASEGG